MYTLLYYRNVKSCVASCRPARRSILLYIPYVSKIAKWRAYTVRATTSHALWEVQEVRNSGAEVFVVVLRRVSIVQ